MCFLCCKTSVMCFSVMCFSAGVLWFSSGYPRASEPVKLWRTDSIINANLSTCIGSLRKPLRFRAASRGLGAIWGVAWVTWPFMGGSSPDLLLVIIGHYWPLSLIKQRPRIHFEHHGSCPDEYSNLVRFKSVQEKAQSAYSEVHSWRE